MNFRTTIALMIVLVVVFGLVMFSGRSSAPKTDEMTPTPSLLGVKADDLTRISLAGDDGKVVLDKSTGKWRLTEPVNAPADPIAAGGLAGALASIDSKGQIDATPADTGLDKPRFKIELTTKDNKTIKVDVGGRTGAGNNLYIKREGQSRADVVPASLYEQLDKPLKQWRRSTLAEVAGPAIRQVRIATTQQSLELLKTDPPDTWKIAQPTSMPADSSAVSDITIAISNLKAEDFVTSATDQARRYGLDQPTMTVSFSTMGPTTQPSATQPSFTTIQFGKYDDVMKKNVYASVSTEPGVVKVAASSLETFRKRPLELRDKALFSVDPDKVTKLSVTIEKPATTQPTTREASSETVVLERAKKVIGPMTPTTGPTTQAAASQPAEPPSKWKLASKDGVDADDSKVDQVFNDLRTFRADRFVEDPAPVAQPSSTVKLAIETTDANYEVSLIDPGNGKPAVGTYSGLTFELSRFIIDNLEADFVKKPSTSSGSPADGPTPLLPGTMPPPMP